MRPSAAALEEAFHQDRNFVAAVLDAAGALIAVFDREGRIVSFNRALEETMGFASREVEGKRVEEMLAPEDAAGASARLEGVLAGETHSKMEQRWVTRGGDTRLISWTSRALDADNAPADYVVAIGIDLTERRRLEEQLVQSQKMEAVGRLAAGVAHDFNNLLTAITGYSDLLLDGLTAADPMRKDLEEIKHAGERAGSLTKQLLAFSRKQVLQLKVLNLSDLIVDMEGILRRLVGESISLVIRPAAALGAVIADPVQIEQVILNLAVNARDAMPDGGALTIETRNVSLGEKAPRHLGLEGGRAVVVEVRDSGCGMDAETRSHLFEPFFTTKEIGKGTGLGLSTAYGIVKQSGGAIEVESEPGAGSTFKIYLPRVAAAVSDVQSRAAAHTLPRGTETVLLAEDEEEVRALLRRVLVKSGYTVLEAIHGLDAVRWAEDYRGPIHLLVTDIVMPGLGGADLARRLRVLRPDMRVLYISGYADQGPSVREASGPDAVLLQKPFSAETLAEKVRAVLDRR